ncbi:hypothetical protein Hdeb2414_s0962g00968801 [Helianthus debilis subsp. tardiflorus]
MKTQVFTYAFLLDLVKQGGSIEHEATRRMRNSQWQLGLKMVKGLILVPKTDCLILMMQLCSDFHQGKVMLAYVI